MSATNVMLEGHEGAAINAYQVVSGKEGALPGVLVIHHLPGWDSSTKEITRRFAAEGYNAICPNLYAREGLDTDPDDAAAAARANGGVPTNSSSVTPERHRRVACPAKLQRQGWRDRLLLWWSPVVPHRGEPARRCRGRLLRRFRDRDSSEGFPLKVVPLVDRTPHWGAHCSDSSVRKTSSPLPSTWTELDRPSSPTTRPTSSTPMKAPVTPSSRPIGPATDRKRP